MVEIKKGIPLPPKRPTKYDWIDEIEVGDCVEVGECEIPSNTLSTLHQLAKRRGIKLTGRTEGKFLTVWRVE